MCEWYNPAHIACKNLFLTTTIVLCPENDGCSVEKSWISDPGLLVLACDLTPALNGGLVGCWPVIPLDLVKLHSILRHIIESECVGSMFGFHHTMPHIFMHELRFFKCSGSISFPSCASEGEMHCSTNFLWLNCDAKNPSAGTAWIV